MYLLYIQKWLKPNGQLLITDYCCAEGEHSKEFNDYIAQRGYTLLSPKNYGELLEKVGFNVLSVLDNTQQFIEVLNNEKQKFNEQHDEFVKKYSEDDYNHILDGWNSKLVRCDAGDQKWGFFHAIKNN